LQATQWITDIAAWLQKGFVLTIDYGFPAFELYQPARSTGTLACYHRHQVHDNPYIHIGEQDITAHVNFSALYHWGAKSGLSYCGYTDQSRFLHALGLVSYIRELETAGHADAVCNKEKLCALQTFLMSMGHRLKVLVQQKGLHRPQLSGMRFALGETAFHPSGITACL
jgi:SAM-dependent MidA family methyltransferase